MFNSGFVFSVALLASLPGSAAAQSSSPPSPVDQIVVQGRRVDEQPIRNLVGAVQAAPYLRQIGRFNAPACPVAMGLPAVQNAAIAQRMREVAAAAAMRVAREPCTPNIFVIVAPDKKWAVDTLAIRFPHYFENMSKKDILKLASSPGPAAAWQIRSLLSADGQILERAGMDGYYVVSGTQNQSRLQSPTVPIFVASVIVIDIKAAGGLTTTQLADYAAMRTFIATDPEKIVQAGTPTILGVLGQPDDRMLPVTLSYWDLNLLKALYSTDNSYYANFQRGDMEQIVKQELRKSGVPAPH